MAGADERLTALEIKVAEQERTIEDLSGQLAEQWSAIEQMQKRLEALTRRLSSVENWQLRRMSRRRRRIIETR